MDSCQVYSFKKNPPLVQVAFISRHTPISSNHLFVHYISRKNYVTMLPTPQPVPTPIPVKQVLTPATAAPPSLQLKITGKGVEKVGASPLEHPPDWKPGPLSHDTFGCALLPVAHSCEVLSILISNGFEYFILNLLNCQANRIYCRRLFSLLFHPNRRLPRLTIAECSLRLKKTYHVECCQVQFRYIHNLNRSSALMHNIADANAQRGLVSNSITGFLLGFPMYLKPEIFHTYLQNFQPDKT